MVKQGTVDELFELAILAERQAESLYLALHARFAHHPQVAEFWRQYAADEAGHAHALVHLREAQSVETLALPADPEILIRARSFSRFSVDRVLNRLEDLEDAYQLVNEVENGETNVVFDFLVTYLTEDKKAQDMMRAQLADHVTRLVRQFPASYSTSALRRLVTLLP